MSEPGPRPIIFESPQLPKPPGSPTEAPPGPAEKRRKHLRESEDNSGELSLESFLYRTDPYRSSSLKIPYPLPTRLHKIVPATDNPIQRDPELASIIRRILGDHGVEYHGFHFCGQSKPGYPGGDAIVKTLRILVNVDDNVSTTGWSKARRAVSKMLPDRAFFNIEVEILDTARTNVLSIFPIAPDHPVISMYESLRAELIEELIRSLGDRWTSLCLFSVGRNSEKTNFAVVVTVRPFTVHNWLALRYILRKMIERNFEALNVSQQSGAIDFEFVPGGWSALNETDEIPGLSFDLNLSTHPKLGTSIGVQGERGGGSLGGFFELKCGTNVHRGFLTNYHVVRPSSAAHQLVKDLANNEGTLYRPQVPHDATKSNVHFFALKDIKATKEHIEDRISDAESGIQEILNKQKQRELFGVDPDARLEQPMLLWEKTKKDMTEKMAKMQHLPVTMGKVLVSSGLAFNANGRVMDWAFVEMLPTQINRDIWDSPAKNQLPHEEAAGMYMCTPDKYGRGHLPYDPGTPPRSIQGFGKLEMGKWYFKIGRTTGITTGLCHGTKVILRTKGTEELTGARTISKPVEMLEEFIILDAKRGQNAEDQKDFCQPDDSGALIIDSEGYVAGLLYASYSSLTGPRSDEGLCVAAGIATTMPDVLESIRLKTTPRDASGNPTGPPGQLLLP